MHAETDKGRNNVNIPTSLMQKHDVSKPHVREIEKCACDRIMKFCANKGYAFLSRSKGIGSLIEKIETGRYASWSAIDDLYACTIVIPFFGLRGRGHFLAGRDVSESGM